MNDSPDHHNASDVPVQMKPEAPRTRCLSLPGEWTTGVDYSTLGREISHVPAALSADVIKSREK
jgi:hypothetical protein